MQAPTSEEEVQLWWINIAEKKVWPWKSFLCLQSPLHRIISSTYIKNCLFSVHVVFIVHSHCFMHAHTHACRDKGCSYTNFCQSSVLPQTNHFLLKVANTFATWLEWAGGLCILIKGSQGRCPTGLPAPRPFSPKVTSRPAPGWSEGPLCPEHIWLLMVTLQDDFTWSAKETKPKRASQRECQR